MSQSIEYAGRTVTANETTAIELFRCAIAHAEDSRLVGNIRAFDLAKLAASSITSCCPQCGAEPWVNIDCDLCLLASDMIARGEL